MSHEEARLQEFLKKLTELSHRYGYYLEAEGDRHSMRINDAKNFTLMIDVQYHERTAVYDGFPL